MNITPNAKYISLEPDGFYEVGCEIKSNSLHMHLNARACTRSALLLPTILKISYGIFRAPKHYITETVIYIYGSFYFVPLL